MDVLYCLSPDFSFVDNHALTDPAFSAGLLNNSSGKVLLLNAETAALLTVFRGAASVTDAVRFFAQQLDAPTADIYAVVWASVETFERQGILITTKFLRQKAAHPFPALQSGTHIKGYSVVKELSATPPIGIYLVKTQSGKRCVLKKLFIHPKAPQRVIRTQKEKFAYEFELLDHLKGCPSVGSLIEFDPDETIGVTDYFAGVSMRRFMNGNHENRPTATRLSLFCQLLDCMAGLHSRDVLHGDVHYSNVLVNKKGQLRLIDFDLAFFWRDRAKKKLTYGGITDFLPPERVTDDAFHQSTGAPDFRAEVYQIGILGYFIFQGRLPFVGHTWRELVSTIRNNALVWETPVPVAIREIIETALCKQPAERFASAVAMRAATGRAMQ